MLSEKNLENRRFGIGASEAATAMGVNKYMSAYELWRIKSGIDPQPDLSDVPCVHWGNIHEESIAQEYANQTGEKVRRMTQTIFHKEHPFMLCHLDRKIEGKRKHLECKYAMYHSDDWGANGTDIVPMNYIVQVQYQLAVTGYEEADLAVLISGWDFRIYHFKRDEELISIITNKVKDFWKCVTDNTPPELSNRGDVEIAYPVNDGTYIQADTNIVDTINSLKLLKQEIKKYEAEKKSLEEKVALYIQKADGIVHENNTLVTYKADARGTRRLLVR